MLNLATAPKSQESPSSSDWRFIVCLVLGASMGACAKQPASTLGSGEATSPPVSFDGRYEGSIQVSSASSNVAQQQCATGTATIAPNGLITGNGGDMQGTVSGSHMLETTASATSDFRLTV